MLLDELHEHDNFVKTKTQILDYYWNGSLIF